MSKNRRSVNSKPKSAVAIGGGFIGVEIAENLMHRGILPLVKQISIDAVRPRVSNPCCKKNGSRRKSYLDAW